MSEETNEKVTEKTEIESEKKTEAEAPETAAQTEAENTEKKEKPKWFQLLFNIHTLILLLIVGIIIFLVVRLSHWGVKVNSQYIDERGIYTDGRDTYDDIFPLTDDAGNYLANKSPHTVLFFGNGSFAEDRHSKDNVVNMIAERTGATVYNCSFEGSYLAAKSDSLMHTESGLDVYNFYWLCLYLVMHKEVDYFDWLETLPDATILPETKEVRKILETVDMNTVDTIAIMYDASDYLAGSMMTDPNNLEEVMSFTGNLNSGIQILQKHYPNIRIIVLSPTYAYGIADDGSYVSSDVKIYEGGATLSAYVMSECETAVNLGVSFLDNLYGTFNEDEVDETMGTENAYLRDHIHLAKNGKELLVKRFIAALTKFDNK